MSLVPYLINGTAFGLSIALIALALALIWRTVGMIDFGLAAVYLITAYTALILKTQLEWPFLWCAAGALIVAPLASIGIYTAVYRHFIKRNSALFVLVLVALCLHIAVQHILAATMSAQKFFLIDDIIPGWEIGGTRLNAVQITKMVLSLVALAGVAYFCHRTDRGRTILAVADNRTLAQGIGISTDATYRWTYGIAGLIVGAAVVPEIAENGVDPYIATTPVFLGMAAIIVGGLATFTSPVLAAVLLGICFHLAVWGISSSWQEVVTYAIVIAVLLLRPQGLFDSFSPVRQRA
ncbi:branched-chain amino acid ABC transporter permease [Microvirga zambiensis]|uniref:branched-chain amino acid ABC transporter permease n=1 Tax=Microvirga zambiensis TaxID=1402137 RepID=UPI00191D7183|nr:branched-chain amino acid ABC transporter permease [Microvirga zambiensis]